MNKPLAAALRPESLEDVCGQQHLLNKDAVFRRAIENGAIQNMIFNVKKHKISPRYYHTMKIHLQQGKSFPPIPKKFIFFKITRQKI